MLSEADRPYVERILGPIPFVIENGSVRVLESGVVTPTPQEIEARVNDRKRLEHRWTITPSFIDHFVLYDNVVIQAGQSRSSTPSDWTAWINEFLARIDNASSATQVRPPVWPPIPQGFRWTDGLRDLADRIGHPDARK